MSQWIRKLICTVSGVVVKDLRIEFSVSKDIAGAPNLCKVKIFNLKESNRVKIKEEHSSLLLEGGYEDGSIGVLHQGTIRTVINRRESVVDIVTEVSSGDGDLNHRFGYINKTFSVEETRPKNIVLELHKRMIDVRLGEIKGLDGLPPLKRPLTLVGTIANELTNLCRKHELYWSIQNGYLEIIPYDSYLNEVTIVSRDTGMVGTPEPTELGVHVKTLLNHKIRPNRLIRVISEDATATGLFRVNEVTYSGNNMDGDYTCDILGARVESGVRHEKYKKDI